MSSFPAWRDSGYWDKQAGLTRHRLLRRTTRSSTAVARQSTPSTQANEGVRAVALARAAFVPGLVTALFAAQQVPCLALDAHYRACVAQTPAHPCQARAAPHPRPSPTLDDTSYIEDAHT